MTTYRTDADFAKEMDKTDSLAKFRPRFHLPQTPEGNPCIYLCGNSLGLQPVSVEAAVQQELTDWQNLGVEGHFHAKHPWMPYHKFTTEAAAYIVGAKPAEVVMMNGLTANLHLMMVSFYRPTKTRYKILIEHAPFPSDRYAIESQIRFHGFDPASSVLELQPREGEPCLRTEDIEKVIADEGESIALVLIGGVQYYTGQAFDMPRITTAAQAKGCIVGFDLAHAAGNIPLQLHDWGVDFACWCSYKYLNAGPGAIAGCFVHERHAQNTDLPRFTGWWGHDQETRFKMAPHFHPMTGAEGWQLSNPPILSFAAVRAALEIFQEAGMEKLREKSITLTGYLEYLLQQENIAGLNIMTPSDPAARGCQLSITLEKGGRSVFEALTAQGVICDWREPNCIRVAPVPLYNSFNDVYRFVQIFKGAAG